MIVDLVLGCFALGAVALAFFVSAAAGLGGSLVLVPALALVLGTRDGVALSALLLAANNVVKVAAYRTVLPVRRSLIVIALTIAGTAIGARLLLTAPEELVAVAVIASLGGALLAERRDLGIRTTALAPGLALAAGATSGFAGTSGPLKGVAIRSLRLDRLHTVGSAALVSLAGDVTKTAVFTEAQLLTASTYGLALLAAPIMIGATFAGRRFNHSIGEHGYQRLFWLVMGGYTARLLVGIAP